MERLTSDEEEDCEKSRNGESESTKILGMRGMKIPRGRDFGQFRKSGDSAIPHLAQPEILETAEIQPWGILRENPPLAKTRTRFNVRGSCDAFARFAAIL